MLFDANNRPVKSAMSGRDRLRLWGLVASLGLVLAAINHLNKPQTAQRLDQLFGVEAENVDSIQVASSEAPQSAEDHVITRSSATNSVSPVHLSPAEAEATAVKDNTYFRPAERGAWFDTFARLEGLKEEQLASESLGEITYAQFLQQPEEYRHQVVTLRGTVVRQEEQRPGENRLGIESYHRLWLSPQGGGQWPLVVFCRRLNDDFPRGDDLREEVIVRGVFFKNWSYPYDGGLGLAPVVLANEVDWKFTTPSSPISSLPVQQLVWACAGAGVLALLVVWMAVRNTTRRPRSATPLPKSLFATEPGIEQSEEKER